MGDMNRSTKSVHVEPYKAPWYWPVSWKPTSDYHLYQSEQAILSTLQVPFTQEFIGKDGLHVNTVKVGEGPPLVMVHGFGAGIGLWVNNLEALSQKYTVYAIDVPGFGRSSRPQFAGKTPEDAIEYFVENLETWREAMGLEKFTLLGHSLGAYISAHYAIQQPERIDQLFLIDPWGVPEKPANQDLSKAPLRVQLLAPVLTRFNPLAALRLIGPWGPGLVDRFRQDIREKFMNRFEDNTITNYIYHLNTQSPASGEDAFSVLSVPIAYAAKPLLNTFHQISPTIPVHFVYGNHSWMDRSAAEKLKDQLQHSHPNINIHVIWGSHHVYVDDYDRFNATILSL